MRPGPGALQARDVLILQRNEGARVIPRFPQPALEDTRDKSRAAAPASVEKGRHVLGPGYHPFTSAPGEPQPHFMHGTAQIAEDER